MCHKMKILLCLLVSVSLAATAGGEEVVASVQLASTTKASFKNLAERDVIERQHCGVPSWSYYQANLGCNVPDTYPYYEFGHCNAGTTQGKCFWYNFELWCIPRLAGPVIPHDQRLSYCGAKEKVARTINYMYCEVADIKFGYAFLCDDPAPENVDYVMIRDATGECERAYGDCFPADSHPDGRDYTGTRNTTVNGRTCQVWDSQKPHKHRFKYLPVNYCRNPDKEPGPWCYTTDPNKRWELCGVSACPDCGSNELEMYHSCSCGGSFTGQCVKITEKRFDCFCKHGDTRDFQIRTGQLCVTDVYQARDCKGDLVTMMGCTKWQPCKLDPAETRQCTIETNSFAYSFNVYGKKK